MSAISFFSRYNFNFNIIHNHNNNNNNNKKTFKIRLIVKKRECVTVNRKSYLKFKINLKTHGYLNQFIRSSKAKPAEKTETY